MQQSTPHRWWLLIAMASSLALIMVDQTFVAIALPRMQQELDLSATGAQWVVNAYILSMVTLVACAGRVGDSMGLKRTFIIGVTIFGVASLLCAIATNESWLLAARVLQGVGASLMQPSSSAIVINAFDDRERGKAMAIYASTGVVFMGLGPAIGGFLTQYVSWRWGFGINIVIVLAAIGLALKLCPSHQAKSLKLHLPSTALFILAMPLFVLGLQQSYDWGLNSPITWLTLGTGLISLISFSYWQSRQFQPLFNFSLFSIRGFKAGQLIIFFVQFSSVQFSSVQFSSVLLFPLYSVPSTIKPYLI
jgi:MFS family permease